MYALLCGSSWRKDTLEQSQQAEDSSLAVREWRELERAVEEDDPAIKAARCHVGTRRLHVTSRVGPLPVSRESRLAIS